MRKLSQGEPVKIAADDYNRWQEAGRAHAMSRLNQSQQIVAPDSQEGIVLVKNTLSRAMPRFSVLGLRGSTYNPLYSDQQLTEFKNQIALHGETPSSITSGRFCVLQNDAQPGEVVAGMVSGVTPCRIKVESLTDEFAEIETTTTVDQTRYLKSGSSGSAQILFRPEYTGEQWGVVRLGNRPAGDTEIVQVVHPGETTGEVVLANASGVHPGYIATADEITLNRGDAVWILFVDQFDTDDGLTPAVNEEYYGPARRSGEYTVSDDTRPLYVFHRGNVVDIVQVYHSSESQYEVVAANADNVHPGKVKRVVEGAMTTPGDCWILFVNKFGTLAGDVPVVNEEYYGPARLSGSFTSGAVELPLYVVRYGIETEEVTRFELTSTLALSGDAEAILLDDDGGDWTDGATAIQVYDLHTAEGMWAGATGYRGWAIKIEGTHASGRQRYGIIWMEQIAQSIQFTSTEYMGASTAGRMAVTVNWYDHQGKDPGSVIVRDPQGQFPDVHTGAKGTAVYDYHNGYYRVVSCQRVALFADAVLSAVSCGSSMSISSFSIRSTGDYVGSPPTTPTTPLNTCGHAGQSGDTVLLRRVNNTLPNPTWEVVDIVKHVVPVITNLRLTGLTLQYQTTDVFVERCSVEPNEWITWHTASAECQGETTSPGALQFGESEPFMPYETPIVSAAGAYGDSFNSPTFEANQ